MWGEEEGHPAFPLSLPLPGALRRCPGMWACGQVAGGPASAHGGPPAVGAWVLTTSTPGIPATGIQNLIAVELHWAWSCRAVASIAWGGTCIDCSPSMLPTFPGQPFCCLGQTSFVLSSSCSFQRHAFLLPSHPQEHLVSSPLPAQAARS